MEKQTLSYEVVEELPREFDFAPGAGDEEWDIPLDLAPEEIENEEFTPLMNYIYPLGWDFKVPKDFRKKLNNTTIVRVGARYYLALTGGGMDLSWEICDSYIRLGYYPPAHFCRLPRMSGRGKSAEDLRIIEVCNEALRTVIKWNQQRLDDNLRSFPK
jgi:hypothetical protein